MNLPRKEEKADKTTNYAELLAKIGKNKDRDAFIKVFNFFAPRLKSYFLKRGESESSAEEIAQNTMLTIWEKANKYSPEKAAASTWIFTIARNKRIDALRKRKKLQPDSENLKLQNIAVEIKEDYADDKTIKKLSDALGDLPKNQLKLIHMSFFDEKTHSTIAKETKIPLGTIKSRIRSALNKLKRSMGEHND